MPKSRAHHRAVSFWRHAAQQRHAGNLWRVGSTRRDALLHDEAAKAVSDEHGCARQRTREGGNVCGVLLQGAGRATAGADAAAALAPQRQSVGVVTSGRKERQPMRLPAPRSMERAVHEEQRRPRARSSRRAAQHLQRHAVRRSVRAALHSRSRMGRQPRYPKPTQAHRRKRRRGRTKQHACAPKSTFPRSAVKSACHVTPICHCVAAPLPVALLAPRRLLASLASLRAMAACGARTAQLRPAAGHALLSPAAPASRAAAAPAAACRRSRRGGLAFAHVVRARLAAGPSRKPPPAPAG